MSRDMLRTSNIYINRRPVFFLFRTDKTFCIMRIHKTQIIPRRTCPLRHSIGLPFSGALAFRTDSIHPLSYLCERRFAGISWSIRRNIWKKNRQHIFRNRNDTTLFTVNKRYRIPPITLTRKYPIPKFVRDLWSPTHISNDPHFYVNRIHPVILA